MNNLIWCGWKNKINWCKLLKGTYTFIGNLHFQEFFKENHINEWKFKHKDVNQSIIYNRNGQLSIIGMVKLLLLPKALHLVWQMKFYGGQAILIHWHIVFDCFQAIPVLEQSWVIDLCPPKPKIFTVWSFTESVPTINL